MTPVETLLAKLPDAKKTPKGWSARCPAHEDRRASLSIAEGDHGRALVNCHAGCKVDAVCAAVGLRVLDLMPTADTLKPIANGKPRIVATYEYRDEAGELLFQVVRYEPKDFRQRRPKAPKAGGGWDWSVKGVRVIPYRLPELLAKPARAVVVVEGEKDVDNLAGIGVLATCNAGGAGKWTAKHAEFLRDRHVIILADNDDPGRNHAQQVAATLQGIAATARIVDLPNLFPKGDVSDWITAGGTKDELKRLAKATPAEQVGRERKSSYRHNGKSGRSVPASRDEWPAPRPLPHELPAVAPFENEVLPEKFRPWIQDIAERIQCPADFPAVAAMVGLAAIVGRKVGIRPKRHDDWLVVANLWGAVIGRPGVMKTPAIVEPIKPLKRLEIEAKRAFQAATKEHAALALVLAANRKHREREIGKLASKDSSGALALAQSLVQDDEPAPLRRRYIVNDSTVEKLGEILNENSNGVLVYRDELTGLLRSLDKEGQEASRAFYLEAWNGTGRYTFDRIGRGTIDIESAIVSIIGGIQPGPFRDYMREAVRGGRGDDGLMQRFQLAVWPDTNQPWRNVDRWPDTNARQAAFDVFENLRDLDPVGIGAVTDTYDPDGIPFLRFDCVAQDEFGAWRENLENRLRSEQDHPAIESHLAKYRSLIPSLALLIHLADTGGGPVGSAALRKGLDWGTYLESHARRIYSVAVTFDAAAARTLAKKLLAREFVDGFALRDVYRNGWTGLATRDEAAAATELLTDLDWLRAEEQRTEGRPALVHFVNPRIHEPGPHWTDKTDKRVAEGASGGSVSSSPGTLPDSEADGTTEDDGWGEV